VTIRDIFAGIAGFVTSIGQWFNEGLLTLVYGDFLDLTVGQFIFTSLIIYSLYLIARHTVFEDFKEDFKDAPKSTLLNWLGAAGVIFWVWLIIEYR